MRIDTSGDKAWRDDLYERTADVLAEGTKAGGIDEACQFAIEMIGDRHSKGALEEALEHPDMTPELAEILSTDILELTFTIEETRELHIRS